MSSDTPDAQTVKKRLFEVIVGADVQERKQVMQQVKRVKPFTFDFDVDTSIILHLCRCLKDLIQAEHEVEQKPALNIIRTMVDMSPRCPLLNVPIRESEDEAEVTVYDRIVPLIAAVLLRLPVMAFKQTEQLLVQYLLDTESMRVLIASDVWCIICRAAERLQVATTEFLFQLALMFPQHDRRRVHIHSLLRRLMRFMDPECHSFLLNKYDPVTNSFDFALQYLSPEKREEHLNRMMDQILGSNSCLLSHVEAVCHLLPLTPQADDQVLATIKELVHSFRDLRLDVSVQARITECERLLSSI